MSKNNKFGKFLAFTTTVAAIGGTCYIFRDRIKESTVYKKATDTFSNLFHKASGEVEDEDDFIFDDDFEEDFTDDVFSDTAKQNREYTSITINPKAIVTPDAAENITSYENEGLSDISEDSDVLADQDKLDF